MITAATAVGALGAFGAMAAPQPAHAAGSASVWLTTPDRANLLGPQAPVAFGTAGSGTVITVNPAQTYQSMVGFGASITDASASVIAG